MNRTIHCLMLLAAVAATPACLDNSDTVAGAPGLRPDKPQNANSTLPSGVHAWLLADLGQLAGAEVRPDAIQRVRLELPTEWAEAIPVPETCPTCTLDIVHVTTLDTWSVQVFRDDAVLCAITRTSRGTVTDTCAD